MCAVRPGSIEILRIESSLLADNPLGDSPLREVPVYLPAAAETGAPPPVIYCLAGYPSGGHSWLNRVPFGDNLAQRMDRLIAGGAPPAILVMPDCTTRLGGSQYVNSTALGRYEDHLVHEIVPLVDRRFASSGMRGLLGKSSGGYGALVLAMRHPHLFHAVASHAGDLYFEWCYKPALPLLARAVMRAGSVAAWLDSVLSKPKKSGADIGNLSTLCACAAYLPDPSAPLGFRVPFDPHSGELDEEGWARFAGHDPIAMVAPHAAALRTLKLLFFDAGSDDEYHLQLGARILARRLRELAIGFEYEEFADGHRDTSYRYDVSLPKLAAALGHTRH
jgi:enterochelin esterase family protein